MNEIIEKIKRHFRFRKIKYIRFEHSYLKNKSERAILKFLMRSFVFSFILLIGIMLLPPVKYILMYLTGTSGKLELIQLIGWGLSGIIAVFVAFGLLQRATALDKQNKISEKGQVHERFKTATDHLGSEHVLVRIASFNEFYHIAEIEPDLRKTIFDILCAYLRHTTKSINYQERQNKPTEEMQSLINILFKSRNKNGLIFVDINADLVGVNLQHANLQEANLQHANLQEAKLQYTNLYEANLQHANLQKADLQGADIRIANLQYTKMRGANLNKAHMPVVKLQCADMREANLQGAQLRSADLQGADIRSANLQNADLEGAKLFEALITSNDTKMPDDWEYMVQKDEYGETGVIVDIE